MNSAFPNKKIWLDLLPRLTHRRNRAPVCRTQREAPEDSLDDDDDDDILIAFDAPHVPVPLPAVEPERPFLCRSLTRDTTATPIANSGQQLPKAYVKICNSFSVKNSFLAFISYLFNFYAHMRTWQAKAGGNVTRSLKFILSLFYFPVISKLFSTIFIILMIINLLFT